ncbi:hypothetical protein GCM10009609_75400 [Pseudonocardia aurantiaca]|uniref:SAM-dependent methyltransferase n=1 Tax=Pseudonocardia aurantiaca TaxID=75290 RepID=A0ABW4FEI1_9PSEU
MLDFDQPIAVLFMGVFGYLDTADEAATVVDRVLDAVPAGSYMALWDGTDTSEAVHIAAKAQADMGSPYHLRSITEIREWFTGLELIDPGLVPINQWRPDDVEVGELTPDRRLRRGRTQTRAFVGSLGEAGAGTPRNDAHRCGDRSGG